jgi:hypothetical protein
MITAAVAYTRVETASYREPVGEVEDAMSAVLNVAP